MELPSEASPAVIVDGERAILLGGKDERGEWSKAVWVYEGGTWTQRGPLPLRVPYPQAWLRGDRIVLVGLDLGELPLLVLDARSLRVLEERQLPWLGHALLHVDAVHRLWAFLEPGVIDLPEPLPEDLLFVPPPASAPAVLELESGALLGWGWGSPDLPEYGRPVGTREASVYRFDPDAWIWRPLAAIPTGRAGLTTLALELPDGSVLMLTDHGDLFRVDPEQGTASLCARLDEDKSSASFRAGLLVAAGEDQVVALRRDRSVRVRPSTGALEELPLPQTWRFLGSALLQGEHLLLMGGYDTLRRGVPPERLALTPRARSPRRPRGLNVLLYAESPVHTYDPGERVRLMVGTFAGVLGTVQEVDGERVKVAVSIFGRDTSVTVERTQLQKLEEP